MHTNTNAMKAFFEKVCILTDSRAPSNNYPDHQFWELNDIGILPDIELGEKLEIIGWG